MKNNPFWWSKIYLLQRDGNQDSRDVRTNCKCRKRQGVKVSSAFFIANKEVWNSRRLFLASVRLTVVMLPESLVFRNVGIKELQRVFRDDSVCNDLIIPYDIGDGKGAETVFGVRLHRDELCLTWGKMFRSLGPMGANWSLTITLSVTEFIYDWLRGVTN